MNQHIDELFKEKLQNHESQASPELWSKIQQNPSWTRHLHRQNVRNLILYTTLGIAAIGIATALIINQHSTSTSPSLEESPNTEESVQQINAPATEKTSTTIEAATDSPTSEKTDISNTQSSIKPNSKEVQAGSTSTPTAEKPTAQTDAKKNNASTSSEAANSNAPHASLQTSNSLSNTTSTPTQNKQATSKSPQTTSPTKTGTAKTKQTNSSPEPSEPVTPTTVNYTSPFAIPNAFTPNGDGLNDIFAPQTERSISNYHIDIYTMGGERVFSSKNIDYGWNGEYQGGLMTGGTYVYVIKYRDPDGTDRMEKGQLLLIR